MRTQGCRDQLDYVLIHCHGLSKDAQNSVRAAGKFCKERAPYLEMESTQAINAIRVIKDPITQGDVLRKIKEILDSRIDPRTGEKIRKVGGITMPMVKWIVQWVESGEKPPYTKRGANRIKVSFDSELIELMRDGAILYAEQSHQCDKIPAIENFCRELSKGLA